IFGEGLSEDAHQRRRCSCLLLSRLLSTFRRVQASLSAIREHSRSLAKNEDLAGSPLNRFGDGGTRQDRVSIRPGHGVGKTTFESWLILGFLLTGKNWKIPVAANSQDQLRDTIWPEISKWHRQLLDALKNMSSRAGEGGNTKAVD